MRFGYILLCLWLVSQVTTRARATCRNVEVKTAKGSIIGCADDNVQSFLGIPYAQAPVGSLRFRPPQEYPSWNGSLNAKSRKSVCAQLNVFGGLYRGSEDCLYLEVHAPHRNVRNTELKPVLFWIHGGGFVAGDAYQDGLYDAKKLASDSNVVVVSANYRLGAFGFLALEELRNESSSTGNYGIQDQRAALVWVQKNIRQFGGDPDKVTIIGESAGAMSVCHHVSNGFHSGLFHNAIIQSGTCDSPEFFVNYDKAISFGRNFAAKIGCSMDGEELVDCLRRKPTEDLMSTVASWFSGNWFEKLKNMVKLFFYTSRESQITAMSSALSGLEIGYLLAMPALSPVMPWGPVIDGSENGLPRFPLEMIQLGLHNKVPLIIGTNKDEGSIFTPFLPLIVPNFENLREEEIFASTVQHILSDYGPTVKSEDSEYIIQLLRDHYNPGHGMDSQIAAISILLADYIFRCPSRRAAFALSSSGIETYLYQFSHTNPWLDVKRFGSYHTLELHFLFDNRWPFPFHSFYTESDHHISSLLARYWGNFARTSNPNDSEGSPICHWSGLGCKPARNCAFSWTYLSCQPISPLPFWHSISGDGSSTQGREMMDITWPPVMRQPEDPQACDILDDVFTRMILEKGRD